MFGAKDKEVVWRYQLCLRIFDVQTQSAIRYRIVTTFVVLQKSKAGKGPAKPVCQVVSIEFVVGATSRQDNGGDLCGESVDINHVFHEVNISHQCLYSFRSFLLEPLPPLAHQSRNKIAFVLYLSLAESCVCDGSATYSVKPMFGRDRLVALPTMFMPYTGYDRSCS